MHWKQGFLLFLLLWQVRLAYSFLQVNVHDGLRKCHTLRWKCHTLRESNFNPVAFSFFITLAIKTKLFILYICPY